jgi:hypothetical protein
VQSLGASTTHSSFDTRHEPGRQVSQQQRGAMADSITIASNAGTSAAQNAPQAPTPETLLEGTRIPKQNYGEINPALWRGAVPIADDVDETVATTYMAYTIVSYLQGGLTDGELFGSFCEDYEGWTEAMFKRVGKEYARELKRVLRYKGVATGRANKSLVPTLVDLLA